ncbi:MAG: hypothetical protein ACLS28_01265 [Clostridium neonatale]
MQVQSVFDQIRVYKKMNLIRWQRTQEKQWGVFMCDPCPLSHEDYVKIYEKAYR